VYNENVTMNKTIETMIDSNSSLEIEIKQYMDKINDLNEVIKNQEIELVQYKNNIKYYEDIEEKVKIQDETINK